MTRQAITVAALMLLAAGCATVYAAWKISQLRSQQTAAPTSDWRSQPADAGQPILKEFTLTAASGREFGTRDLEGKVWVGSFFFASCPGSCKQQNEIVRQLHDEFGPRDVKFVSITCDPEIDTPQRLQEYAKEMGARPDQWYFLTGDLNYIRRVGGEYFQLLVQERGHQDRFAVVDQTGKIRGLFDWHSQTDLKKLKETLEKCLSPSAATEPATST